MLILLAFGFLIATVIMWFKKALEREKEMETEQWRAKLREEVEEEEELNSYYKLSEESKDILWQFIGEGKRVLQLQPDRNVEILEKKSILVLEAGVKRGDGPFRYVLSERAKEVLRDNPDVLGG